MDTAGAARSFFAAGLLALLALAGCGGERATAAPAMAFPEIRDMVCVRGSRDIEPFLIDRYEVTNAEYARFLAESGYEPVDPGNGFLGHWVVDGDGHRHPPAGKEEHPVTWVSFADAEAFARFRGKRLPSKREWERAAASGGAATYPWATEHFSRYYANMLPTGLGDTAPVGMFADGRTELGCFDMAGNVWEWTALDPDDGASALTSDQRVIKGGSFREDEDWARIAWWGSQLRPREGGLGYRAESVYEEYVRTEPVTTRSFDLGFRCVMPARPFLDQALVRLNEMEAPRARRARAELLALGEHLGSLTGEADQKRRLQFRRNLPETRLTTIRSLFPVDREQGDGQDVALLLETGLFERFDQHGDLRCSVKVGTKLPPGTTVRALAAVMPDARRVALGWTAAVDPTVLRALLAVGIVQSVSLMGVTLFDPLDGRVLGEWTRPGRAIDLAVVPDAHRVVASWAVQPPGGGSLVGVTLFDPLAGKAVREWKWPGRAIDLLPSSRAFVALVVRDRFWAPAARLMAHWIAGVAPAWLRAFQRYEPVGPPGPPGWRWAWPGLKAFDEVREDLFSADIDTTPELPDRTSDLYLVQAGDGALAAQCTVGGMLERLVEPGAPPPDPSQAWLLRGHLSGSLLRVELAGSGLVLTDVGRATWQDRAALAVPSTEPADQGSLVLLGPDDDPRFHLIAVTANGISERWAADLVPLSRGLSEVRLAMPGILTIEDALDRTLVVNVQTGQPHEPAFFNGATVIGHVARQVWLSALEPRSVVLTRIDQRAPERRLRIDTLGSRQMLFDRSGHADLGLALIQSDAVFASEGVISVFRMDVLTSPLDSLLDDFLQAETRDHEAR